MSIKKVFEKLFTSFHELQFGDKAQIVLMLASILIDIAFELITISFYVSGR